MLLLLPVQKEAEETSEAVRHAEAASNARRALQAELAAKRFAEAAAQVNCWMTASRTLHPDKSSMHANFSGMHALAVSRSMIDPMVPHHELCCLECDPRVHEFSVVVCQARLEREILARERMRRVVWLQQARNAEKTRDAEQVQFPLETFCRSCIANT